MSRFSVGAILARISSAALCGHHTLPCLLQLSQSFAMEKFLPADLKHLLHHFSTMAVAHFQGKKAMRYIDQRIEGVGRFIQWRLEQLRALHEKGAPEPEREKFKAGLLETINGIYARKDGWTIKNQSPRNMYWDIVDYHLFQAHYSFGMPPGYCLDAGYLHDQHNKAYYSQFNQVFHKLIRGPEGPMA
jgi:hypothetical protein